MGGPRNLAMPQPARGGLGTKGGGNYIRTQKGVLIRSCEGASLKAREEKETKCGLM